MSVVGVLTPTGPPTPQRALSSARTAHASRALLPQSLQLPLRRLLDSGQRTPGGEGEHLSLWPPSLGLPLWEPLAETCPGPPQSPSPWAG